MKKIRHPAPQMERGQFTLLDGEWDFAEDERFSGEKEGWFRGFCAKRKIIVPFSCESEINGCRSEGKKRSIWYQRKIQMEKIPQKRALLQFEGVDYFAQVWLNGVYIGRHEGGYTAFFFFLSNALREGENLLVVNVQDGYSLENPRGKQRWLDNSFSCWYVPTTGIWKSVWLEFTGDIYVKNVKWTPQTDRQMLKAEVFLSGHSPETRVELSLSREGKKEFFFCASAVSEYLCFEVDLNSPSEPFQVRYWSPDDPALYGAELCVTVNGAESDRVFSYFGYRDFRAERGANLLNGAPVYEKFVLYQGYWVQTGLTPPSDEAVEKDLKDIKAMGFNGLRVHQKIESEFFLSLADKLGLMVWCEMPSAYLFNDNMKQKFMSEWSKIVRQKYNHPCIVTWVPFNESWGIRGVGRDKEMQAFADSAYYLTKAYDGMRPVIGNDGWENVQTDAVTVHNYEQDPKRLYLAYCDKMAVLQEEEVLRHQKFVFADGYKYGGQPVLVTEFGGLAFADGLDKDAWGYGLVSSEDAFCEKYAQLCRAIKKTGYVRGYCYTQFSDTWQEKNGLVTMDRKPKVDFAKIRQINDEPAD